MGEKAKKYRGARRPERGPGYLFVSRRLNPPAGLHIAISQNEWTRVYFGKLLFCCQRTLHWSVWVWDEVLRPGFLCPVVKLARQKRDNQVKTLSSIVFATLNYALKNIWKTIKKKNVVKKMSSLLIEWNLGWIFKKKVASKRKFKTELLTRIPPPPLNVCREEIKVTSTKQMIDIKKEKYIQYWRV